MTMEIMLRVAIPDRPGALATVAAAISEVGGDIQAVDVVETGAGTALDDLVVVVADERGLASLIDHLEAHDGVAVLHAGPSRGHPGDGVTRLAVGLQSMLDGSMDRDHAIEVVVGGALRARRATLMPAAESAGDGGRAGDRRLILPIGDRVLVLERAYRFTDTEQQRARALLRLCAVAARSVDPDRHTPDRQTPSRQTPGRHTSVSGSG